MKPVTLATLRELKAKGEKIACLTAYDYSFAQLLDNVPAWTSSWSATRSAW